MFRTFLYWTQAHATVMCSNMIRSGTKLRDCAVCTQPVFARPYQAMSARTCSPVCAHMLATREHPEMESRLDRLAGPRNGRLPS